MRRSHLDAIRDMRRMGFSWVAYQKLWLDRKRHPWEVVRKDGTRTWFSNHVTAEASAAFHHGRMVSPPPSKEATGA